MTDLRISDLDIVTDVLDDDDFAIVHDGVTKRITGANLLASLASGGGGVTELAYVASTAHVDLTSTNSGSPDAVISAGALSFDGSTRICIEFFTPGIATGNNYIFLQLYDGGSIVNAAFGSVQNASTNLYQPVLLRRFLTPSAGSHTYNIKAYKQDSDGGTILGGQDNWAPIYIRITAV